MNRIDFSILILAALGLFHWGAYMFEIQEDRRWNNIEKERLALDWKTYELELRRYSRECSK